jgi:radical SAM superfamily enzyme YgiQ (UPF0313 family)
MATTKVLMVHPRFNADSFWTYTATCEAIGAKTSSPPLGLITVAAMLPSHWEIRLVDRNTAELTDADIIWSDMVMTGGMMPQQLDALHIISWTQRLGRPVVVGGPDPTSSPQVYEAADFRVLGEAEGILPHFITAWEAGERRGTFIAEKFKADVTTTPTPRYDLLKLSDYATLSLQFSRGCPFTCEFCDIIELYGRVPRTKTTAQVLAELEALLAMGHRGRVDFVDDNLIGNKKALKVLLPDLIAWQKRHGYPFAFSTEASINLADDTELLELLHQANFYVIFIGIESPDPETLRLMQKKQNTRRSIPDSVHRIQAAGIIVIGGFIIGFDNESEGVGEGLVQLIEDAAIPVAMISLLWALPNTQLSRRLEREGRLFPQSEFLERLKFDGDTGMPGLNFNTKRPREEILADYREVVARAYTPQAFFSRLRRTGLNLGVKPPLGGAALRDVPWILREFIGLASAMTKAGRAERREFWGLIMTMLRQNPRALLHVASLSALYLHLGPLSGRVLKAIDRQIEDVLSGRWQPPVPVQVLSPPEDACAKPAGVAAE